MMYYILKKAEQDSMLKDMDFCHLEEIYLTNTKENYWVLLQKQK